MRNRLGLVKGGCHSLMPTLEETDPAFQKFDDDGFLHNIGKCFCTEDLKPILDPIINAIAEALQKLGDILEKICEGLLETVKQVVDVGIAAIPGGSAVKADMFGNWVGPVCGDASFKGFDIATAFQQRSPEKPNTNVPDKPPATDNKPPTTDNKPSAIDSRPTTTNDKSPTTTEDKPTTTTTDNPSTTSSTTDSDACKKVEKRARPGCSVMQIHAATQSMTEFACAETRSGYRLPGNGNLKATALDRWGSTAIATRKGNNQHYWPWAQGWILRKDEEKTGGLCERDEWPPALFWPGDNYANRNNMAGKDLRNSRQREDNRGACREPTSDREWES
ncbi:hypothetical protein PG997_001748 [Apiospora hydei]|uniref:Uncharacterized protein n=1 Tax=Apiospora hydei TaxID=1337664 RepID=A0ABR1XEF2_9PEZI